jgi:hypothetical protein
MDRLVSALLLAVLALTGGCKEPDEGLGKPPASVSPKTVAAIDRAFATLDGAIHDAEAAKRAKKATAYCEHVAADIAPRVKAAADDAARHVPRKGTRIAKDGAEWVARYITLGITRRADRIREVVHTCAEHKGVKEALISLGLVALSAHSAR